MPETVTLIGTIATTGYLPKYNARLAPRVLEQIRDKVLSGEMPLQLQHDAFRPWKAEIRKAWIEVCADGEQELKAEFVAARDLYEEIAEEFAREGGPGGLSFSASTTQETLAARSIELSGRSVSLAADAAAWSDEDRLAAGDALRDLGTVELSRLIELSAAADIAKALLEIPSEIWDEVLAGAVGTAVYDALKYLVGKRRAPTVVEIRDDKPGETKITARIQTDEPAVLGPAVKQLPNVAPAASSGNFEFDSTRGLWVPVNLDD